MIPLRVYLRGFLTYRDEQVFDFDGATLWVLAGPNGAGKSAVFDAITLALYGAHRGGKQNAADLINHQSDRLHVEFDFLLDRDQYRVTRTVPRRGQSIRRVQHLIGGAWREVAETSSDKGFENWRDHLIGLSFEAFTATVMLRQGESERLLKTTPSERREILTRLIDLSAYKRLYESAVTRQNSLKTRIEVIREQLKRIEPVSAEQIAEAVQAEAEAQQKREVIRSQIGPAQAQLEQARNWETWSGELRQREAAVKAIDQLLADGETIKADYARLELLERVIPSLAGVVDQRERASESLSQIKASLRQIAAHDAAIDLNAAETLTLAESLISEPSGDDTPTSIETIGTWLDAAQSRVHTTRETLDAAQLASRGLKSLAEERTHLRASLQKRAELETALEDWKARVEQREREKAETDRAINALNLQDTEARETVTRLKTERDATSRKLARFEQVAEQAVCDVCGQPITPGHAALERARLDAQLREQQAEHDRAKATLAEVNAQAKSLATGALATTTALQTANDRLKDCDRDLRAVKVTIADHLRRMQAAYRDLPEGYARRFSLNEPDDAEVWAATPYPDAHDLDEIEQSKARYLHFNQYAERLRVLGEHHRRGVERLADWASAVGRVAADWQAEASGLNRSGLDRYESERRQKQNARKRFAELQESERKLAVLHGQITEIKASLAGIPDEAKQGSAAIQQQLQMLDRAEHDAAEAYGQARSKHENLVGDRDRRSALDSERQTVERDASLAGRLANLLGDKKDGLQLHLLQHAERKIVELANKTLGNLSGNTLWLDLQSAVDESGVSGKALDLRLYDRRADNARPIDVAFASGGQKFRIAVSLALAIGQYVGRESRRIESVIIDEGFGGLDREGRDAMVEALTDLTENLQRIIVVSHQEDFAGAFTQHKYTIRRENGVSVVTREG